MHKPVQLTKEENDILLDIYSKSKSQVLLIYFSLISKKIFIKFVNISNETQDILLDLFCRLSGPDIDGDGVVIVLDESKTMVSLSYCGRIVAEYKEVSYE